MYVSLLLDCIKQYPVGESDLETLIERGFVENYKRVGNICGNKTYTVKLNEKGEDILYSFLGDGMV